MKAMIQQQIAPFVHPKKEDFLGADYIKDSHLMGQKGVKKSEVNFRDLMMNSNREEAARRAAKANGDLSGAKNNEEFFEQLAEQTREKRVPKNKLDKDDFLKLFVTQLQNQDPLSPNDSAEMAAQLANFNGLEQMQNVNTKLEKMIEGQNTSRSIDLVNYVGKEVEVVGGRMRVEGGTPTNAFFKVNMPVASASLEVRDTAGKVMHEMNVGSLSEGEHKVPWDGKLADGTSINDGTYSFDIIAKGQDGELIPVELSTKATIEGVDLKSPTGAFFTSLGKIDSDTVKTVGISGFKKEDAGKKNKTKKPAVSQTQGVPKASMQNPPQPAVINQQNLNKPSNIASPIANARPPAEIQKQMMSAIAELNQKNKTNENNSQAISR